MASIRVEVTAEQIAAAGDDRYHWAKPVEDALAALTGQEVDIDAASWSTAGEHWSIATIGQGAWTIVVDLPADANEWLKRRWGDEADSGAAASTELADRGKPFAFELEVPAWVTALIPPREWVTLTEASRALKTIKPQGLRTAAQQRRDGSASETALAARLGMRRFGRDWLIPRDRLEAEVARRAEASD